MAPRIIRFILIFGFLTCLSLIAFFCKSPNKPTQTNENTQSKWRNVYDTSAHYVGMNACKTCHQSVYESFMQTGMGQSFAPASHAKSAADFSPGHSLVYDKDRDFYYKPYFSGDTFFIKEYRLEGHDTVYQHIQQVNYIVGSGQHTNSHIFGINGFLYQAPITFYTQKHQWDLAPGFEKGASIRFDRMIELECMSCHNGYPDFDPNSENKFNNLKSGIDCERCHGPGSIHVSEKSTENLVDTSLGPDYTIVNPRRLSIELQNNLCQRCHLQGMSVLNNGKSFYDFRPGMKLSEVLNVFLPTYEGATDKMIMASHVERLKKSQCFIQSQQISCITCHNPHVSVKVTPKEQFLNVCQSCHGDGKSIGNFKSSCTEKLATRTAKKNDCILCHMPHNGSIDIPHVAVTDHFIRRRPISEGDKAKITAFLGMKCINNDKVDAITTARSYMEFFEKMNAQNGLLDSAIYYLNKQVNEEATINQNRDFIRAYFLLENYPKALSFAAQLKPEVVYDAWTCYRIGESFSKTNNFQNALPWYERSIQLKKYALDFQNKYGRCQLQLQQFDAAEKTFKFVLSQNSNHILANSNLGYLYLQRQQPTMAYDFLNRALALDPDREQTLLNMAVYYHNINDLNQCRKTLKQLLKRHPENAQAKAMVADLH